MHGLENAKFRMGLTAWILAKLTDDQQLYVEVFYAEFCANWSGNLEGNEFIN